MILLFTAVYVRRAVDFCAAENVDSIIVLYYSILRIVQARRSKPEVEPTRYVTTPSSSIYSYRVPDYSNTADYNNSYHG